MVNQILRVVGGWIKPSIKLLKMITKIDRTQSVLNVMFIISMKEKKYGKLPINLLFISKSFRHIKLLTSVLAGVCHISFTES